MTQHSHRGITVDRLDPAQTRDAATVITASHANYPAFRRLFPDPAVRRRVLRPFMAAAVRDAAIHGHVLAAHDDNGVLGVALWMPPGTFPLSGARKARMTPALIRTALAARGAFRDHLRVGAALENAHPSEISWYLQAMSVHPRAQRRGVGTRLMAPALALADQTNLPCYLQTSDPANIGYYQPFGFDVTQPAIKTFPGGPDYIGMTRPPSRTREGCTSETEPVAASARPLRPSDGRVGGWSVLILLNSGDAPTPTKNSSSAPVTAPRTDQPVIQHQWIRHFPRGSSGA